MRHSVVATKARYIECGLPSRFAWASTKLHKSDTGGDAQTNPSSITVSQHSVETASRDDASAFCEWLSELPEEKASGTVTCRLPTEAE